MVIETVLGGAVGALARLAPEVIKAIDRRNERKHEAVMLDKNIEAEKARGALGLQTEALKQDGAQVVSAIEALKAAIAGQAAPTGVKWVDALTASVRPILTYGIALPYVLGKVAVFGALLWASGINAESATAALAATYTGADMAILSGVLNFWFLGRVFDKRS